MEPVELLQGDPQSWPGVHKLLAAVKVAAELLAQEIDQQIHQTPVPPSNVQAEIDAKKQQLKALDARIVALSKRSGEGELIRPAWEQRALERLFEVGVRRERELASDLDEDSWDVAAWCDQLSDAGLLEQMGSAVAPKRHWKITDKGRESIGYPSAR